MFICLMCEEKFTEPDVTETWDSYDAHGSVAVSYFDLECCPACGSENIDEYESDDEE